MDNASTHEDDEFVVAAQQYLAESMDPTACPLIRDLLNRVLEKKVEIRGLESQVHSLQGERLGLDVEVGVLKKKIAELENMMVGD